MANPTTNFGWVMPTATDLVTDLPADFNVFGQGVDTTMADLKGGTTGQILSKATNTDMDFVWIANDQGDITGVTATSPLTGGGTSGAVTLGILSGTTSNLGAVQLSDSVSSTSTTLAATANAVKSAYDLANTANTAAGTAQTTANAAIPKSTVTTAGDVIYATGSSAVTRLGIGTTGQVLTVAGGVPSWATSAGAGMVLVASGAVSAAATVSVNSCFTSTYTNYRILFAGTNSGTKSNGVYFKLRASGTDSSVSYYGYNVNYFSSNATNNTITTNTTTGIPVGSCEDDVKFSFDVFSPQVAVQTGTVQMYVGWQSGSSRSFSGQGQGLHNVSTAYDGFTLNFTSATVTGTVYIYGYAK